MRTRTCVAIVMAWTMDYGQIAGIGIDQCIGICASEIMKQMEKQCNTWREQLPRPDLLSNCQDGYSSGSKKGCEHYCSGSTEQQRLWSARFEYCSYLRSQSPAELFASCSGGFTAASEGAEAFVAINTPFDDDVHIKEEGVVVRETKKASPNRAKHAQSALMQAREEAQDAYINDKKQDSLILPSSQLAEL
uniref:Uncharacterized protein AlNc14C168G7941 n=1 Tax=Albugo laibachii Nc14 TaxID=890382 RepID=F0WNB1_9STRA|nr:conserved hypothetical protein [Albugo laibachii Nc14]|eukprot:CCA22800.1 conserved hypothetical protein [Albugo laibachii Nc14]